MMKVERMVLGKDAKPYIAVAEIVSMFGLRQRQYGCLKCSAMLGGEWIDVKTGKSLHWADDRTDLLNKAAHLAQRVQ